MKKKVLKFTTEAPELKAKIVKSFLTGEDDYKILSIAGRMFKVQKDDFGNYVVHHLYCGTQTFVGKAKKYSDVRAHLLRTYGVFKPNVESFELI